ncbi:unnamed protein product [Moneuplotes crassus]|uniref:Uncharacterized protein n=1 Tax=Euplotes crassus TaxID=5936 RepID=A0AAD1Y0L7_EUPCR|nr:unnamed protein product [Moneuplotes crassus]
MSKSSNLHNVSAKNPSIFKLLKLWNRTIDETDSDSSLHKMSRDEPSRDISAKIIRLDTREFKINDSDRTLKDNYKLSRNRGVISSTVKGVKKRIKSNCNLPAVKTFQKPLPPPSGPCQDISSIRDSFHNGSTKSIINLKECSRYSKLGNQKYDTKGIVHFNNCDHNVIRSPLRTKGYEALKALQEQGSLFTIAKPQPHKTKSRVASQFKRSSIISINSEDSQEIKKDMVEYFKQRLRDHRKKKPSRFKYYQKRKASQMAIAKLAFKQTKTKSRPTMSDKTLDKFVNKLVD